MHISLAILVAGLLTPLAHADPAKVRMSADGVAMPDVLNPAPFKATLPIVRNGLGASPEELGTRTFNTEKSRKLLENRTKVNLNTQWFMIGFAGADVVGFDLTDGRVTRLVCVYSKERPEMVADATNGMKRLGKIDSGACQVKSQSGKTTVVHFLVNPSLAEFSIDTVSWYLLTHKESDEIATAMLDRKPLIGMSLEQMRMMFGEPEQITVDKESAAYVWSEYRLIRPRMRSGSMSLTDLHDEMQRVALTPPRREISRRIEASFVNGMLTKVGDEKY